MPRRITLKDVAAQAGLSVSCTARALKGRPGFPQATYERVRLVAEKLGYRPDPMMAALSAYRQSQKPGHFQGALAFLMTQNSERETLATPEAGDLLRGARMRAADLGYQLEYFNIGTTWKTQMQAARVLRARGIHGLLIRSFPMPISALHFPFGQFIGIDLFSDPHVGAVPTISSYHAQSMQLVLDELAARGYRHPVLAMARGLNQYLRHGWWTAFLANAGRFEETSVLFDDDASMGAPQLTKWAEARKADVFIYGTSENNIPRGLVSRARRRSRIGVVSMDLLDPACGVAGIYQDRFKSGALAVEWLQSMMITSRIGVPREFGAMMIPGTWRAGDTLGLSQPLG